MFTALSAFGQTVTGSLVGHVADPTGGAVSGVKVVATEITRGTAREAVSNEGGNFTISSMEPGVYKVQVEHAGFKSFVKDQVEVAINSTVRVDAMLEVGAVSETVEVSATRSRSRRTAAISASRWTRCMFENLPLRPTAIIMATLEMVPGIH